MHYFVLDTNVYWDMILDRDRSWSEHQKDNREQHSPHLFSYLKNMLDNNQIRLVVPAIVVREAELSVDTILTDYSKDLKVLEEICSRMPYLSVFGDDFGGAIGTFVEYLAAWRAILVDPSTKERILAQFRDFLSHPYVIPVPLDDSIVQGIVRRQIMRRCPFHRGSSPSYGDAAVIETVVGIERYVQLQPGDEVLLVTRNYKDFSAPGQKEQIHPDVREDVVYSTPEVPLTYSRHLFGVLKERFGVSVPDTIVEEEAQAVDIDEQRESAPAWKHGNLFLLSDDAIRAETDPRVVEQIIRNRRVLSLSRLARKSSNRMMSQLLADLGQQGAHTTMAQSLQDVLGEHVHPQAPNGGTPEEPDNAEESNGPTDPTDSGSK